MNIGHVNLAKSFTGSAAHFIGLIEALDRQGISQYVIVRNHALARRVAVYDNVIVGPVTRSPVIAYCLMPKVDMVHVHDMESAQSGLLLMLTRSIPYVVTRRHRTDTDGGPIARAIDNRAASIICSSAILARQTLNTDTLTEVHVIKDIAREDGAALEMLGNRAAAEHLRVYRRAVDAWHVPALLL